MTQSQRDALDAMARNSPLDLGGDVLEQRVLFEEMLGSLPAPQDVTSVAGELGGVPVVTISPANGVSDKVIFYLHGGAYAIGSAALSVGLAGEITRRTGARAVSIDYRLAPEHPFPAGPNDVLNAYRGLLADGVRPGDIAVVGESAGGGLATGLLASLSEAGLPQPAGAVLISPWVDLSITGESMTSKAAADPSLTEAGLRRRAGDYLGPVDPGTGPASPLFADLSGLPPLLIQVGSHEILLDDAVRLARRAAGDDVSVQLQVWPGVPHVFQAYTGLLDEAGAALDDVGEFITRHW